MQPRRLLAPLAVVCVLVAALTATVVVLGESRRPARQVEPDTDPSAREVLRAWDARRARAWEQADVAALRALYTSGSEAGRADARMLRAYVRRGLAVRGMRSQVLAFEVVREGEDLIEVVLTDRVVGAVAVAGSREWPLPVAAPRERTIDLRRSGGTWLVAAVAERPDGGGQPGSEERLAP